MHSRLHYDFNSHIDITIGIVYIIIEYKLGFAYFAHEIHSLSGDSLRCQLLLKQN